VLKERLQEAAGLLRPSLKLCWLGLWARGTLPSLNLPDSGNNLALHPQVFPESVCLSAVVLSPWRAASLPSMARLKGKTTQAREEGLGATAPLPGPAGETFKKVDVY
jgi:hypothetical protein